MSSLRTILTTPIPRARLLAAIGIASVLVMAATWGAVRWSWGFVVVYVCLAAVLRGIARVRRTSSFMAYPMLPGVSAVIVARFFFGAETSWRGAVHIAAVISVALLLGAWLAEQWPIPSDEI